MATPGPPSRATGTTVVVCPAVTVHPCLFQVNVTVPLSLVGTHANFEKVLASWIVCPTHVFTGVMWTTEPLVLASRRPL